MPRSFAPKQCGSVWLVVFISFKKKNIYIYIYAPEDKLLPKIKMSASRGDFPVTESFSWDYEHQERAILQTETSDRKSGYFVNMQV